jgi:hypothetical protein
MVNQNQNSKKQNLNRQAKSSNTSLVIFPNAGGIFGKGSPLGAGGLHPVLIRMLNFIQNKILHFLCLLQFDIRNLHRPRSRMKH